MTSVFFAFSSIIKKDYTQKLTSVANQTSVNAYGIFSFFEEKIEIFINKYDVEEGFGRFSINMPDFVRMDSTSFENILIFKGEEPVYASTAQIVDFYRETGFDKKILDFTKNNSSGWIINEEKDDVPILMPAPTIGAAKNADEYKEMQNLLIEALTEVAEYAKGSGVKVVIENQSSLLRPDSKIDDLRYILEAVPELGFVLDSGNFFCIGEDVLKAYESLKDRMVRCHCKDWAFNPYGMYIRENMPRFEGVAIGDGVLPLDEMFKKFRDDNFDGGVVLEINARKLTLDMLERSIEFLREEMRV